MLELGFVTSFRSNEVLLYMKEHEEITNQLYQEITNISKPAATLDLKDLLNKGLISKTGTTGRGTYYTINRKG